MIFSSYEFVVFFVAANLFRSLFRNPSAEKWLLLAASYIFYMSWGIPCVFLLLFISLVNYFVALGFDRFENARKRKLLLTLSVAVHLGVLGFFKYANFVIENAWGLLGLIGLHLNPVHYNIGLPVGISFFTFIGMTYTIETYRRNMQPNHNPGDVLLCIAFFPQILAGPINRAVDLLPQFRRRVRATALEFESGLAQFGLGLVKKLVISDRIAPHVNLIFGAPGNYDAFTLLQGLLGYSIQIYCDFSGYSDMAIGCARMMGFHFMENFQMPYSAVNITEFWRRWHISLSTWFRDYLYIPLGGNRKGSIRTYANLMITMLLCGLWHGASWNFVLWGGIHGASLALHRVWKTQNPLSRAFHSSIFPRLCSLASRLLTLGVVVIGWLFFRAESWETSVKYLGRLLSWRQDGTRLISPFIILAIVVVVLVHLLFWKDSNWAREITQRGIFVRSLYYTALTLLVVCLGTTDSSPFIYFRF